MSLRQLLNWLPGFRQEELTAEPQPEPRSHAEVLGSAFHVDEAHDPTDWMDEQFWH